jgi:hypothetical protein
MPVTAVRLQPVTKAVPVPGSATLTFTARSTGAEDASVVVLYSVMDGAAVRISGGGQASPTIGGSSTTVSQRVDFDRTENPTPLAFRVRAVVTEDGVEQFERIWPIRVDSTAMAEAILESGGTLEPEGQSGRKRATKRKPAAKKKASAKKATARKTGAKKAAGKKTAAKKAGTRKSAAKKGAAKKSARKSPVQRAVVSGAKKSAARRGGALKRTATKHRRR